MAHLLQIFKQSIPSTQILKPNSINSSSVNTTERASCDLNRPVYEDPAAQICTDLITSLISMVAFNQHTLFNHMAGQNPVYISIMELIRKKKEVNLFNKAFLKPIEIALKTPKTTEDIEEKNPENVGKLPFGLMQAVKQNIEDNKFTYHPFRNMGEIRENCPEKERDFNYEYLYENNDDNLVNLIKKKTGEGIEIAMCVCMYSEDKSMLQKTIAGIAKNVGQLISMGIESHEIGIFILMDGIEPVDESIISYLEQMEYENQIFFEHDQINDEELLTRDVRDMDEEYEANLIPYIFSPSELEDRKKRRFTSRKREYHRVKNLIRRVEEMEKDKRITFETLDQEIIPYFYKVARVIRKNDLGDTDEAANEYPVEMLKMKYADNITACRPIIYQALSLAKQYYKQYISSRDQLALLNTFRIEVTVPDVSAPRISSPDQKKTLEEIPEQSDHDNSAFMNLFFVTKYKNAGKLSSHNWFFNGFCKELNPKYAFLIDVGLAPEEDALVKMYYAMKNDEKIGGVCGYMGLRIQKVSNNEMVDPSILDCLTPTITKFVDIQKAQQVEYHFAHLIDKPFESLFGFIHVLPGAFSAYRVSALQRQYGNVFENRFDDSKVLTEYFESIETQGNTQIKHIEYSPLQAVGRVLLPDFFFDVADKKTEEGKLYHENIYLAEDRTLCMGIKQNKYNLKYIPDAYAWVDPIKTLHGLLGQRKRWINGSFFAFQKVKNVLTDSDKVENKCALWIQIYYLEFMNKLAFIAPALFLFTIHIAMFAFQADVLTPFLESSIGVSALSDAQSAYLFIYIIDLIYIILFLALIFFSMHLTHRDKLFLPYIYATSTIYGILSITVFVVLTYDIIKGLATGQQTFLITNALLIQSLPGGVPIVTTLRYIIIGIIGLYILPVVTSVICFRRFEYASDILFGTLSFLFYNPTYLNILNLYSLCRIDDISWGTKGLDTQNNKNRNLKESWKKIKIIQVSKFVFYNSLASFFLLGFGNDYVPRFFLTFIVMIILASTMFFKVFLGAIYIIGYNCREKKGKHEYQRHRGSRKDQIQEYYNEIKDSLYRDIHKILTLSKVGNSYEDIHSHYKLVSSIQEKRFKKSQESRNQILAENRSRIFKNSVNMASKHSMVQKKKKQIPMQPIVEQLGKEEEKIGHESDQDLVDPINPVPKPNGSSDMAPKGERKFGKKKKK